MTKEEVYDAQINPLMAQIIEICKANKIAALCTFSLDAKTSLSCTTALLEAEFDPPDQYFQALKIIRGRPAFAALMICTDDHPQPGRIER